MSAMHSHARQVRAFLARHEKKPWPITLAAASMVSVFLIGLYVLVRGVS